MRRRFYTLLVLMVCTGLFASRATFGQTRPTAPDNASEVEDYAVHARLNQSYFDWLTMDVPYIISQQERSAFLQLTSDEDRDFFIEQFWQCRNPAGTYVVVIALGNPELRTIGTDYSELGVAAMANQK
jgi:hypothetical protein